MGEKFVAWTDVTPSVDEILTTVSMWWMLETFPKAIYPYREVSPTPPTPPPVDLFVPCIADVRGRSMASKSITLRQETTRLLLLRVRDRFSSSVLGSADGESAVLLVSSPSKFSAIESRSFRDEDLQGGHFAAMERPHEFTEDMRACFGRLWTLDSLAK